MGFRPPVPGFVAEGILCPALRFATRGEIMCSRVPRFFESKAEFASSRGKHPCEITSRLSVGEDDLFAVDLYGSDNAIVIAWNNRE